MSPTGFALLAALSFAFGSVLQQKGTLQTKAPEGDPHFLAEILRKPVWLLGGVMQLLGWVFQAIALENGSLALVQSLCALSLVIALPLGARLTNQHVDRRSLIGACITLIGIILFVAVGQPQGGTSQPDSASWWSSILIITILILILSRIATRRRGATAAALLATAAGLSYAFQAAVTKVFMTQIGYGVAVLLTSWTTYALIISALAGFVFQQSALKTGFLAPAMAAVNATTLAGSIILGITIFQETISNGSGRMAPAVLGLTLSIIGVAMLASPETNQQEVPTT
jgi:drug/metabolite transporter (DMT)-like permease